MDNIFIKAKNVSYAYNADKRGEHLLPAIKNLNLQIKKGEFVAVIGRNGSGKSTLARLLNALLIPTGGVIYIGGERTDFPKNVWDIRKSVGMIFQNPENQFVASSVKEDIAFGPENLGIAAKEIVLRVDESLRDVGMEGFGDYSPHNLSGGQKQKIAIAGILAMRPECIVLDEATSMLDPVGRKEILDTLKRLNDKEGITIVHITHHMEEAVLAKRVIVIANAHVVMDGEPSEVFSRVDEIKKLGLDVPQVTELFCKLKKAGFKVPSDILTTKEAFRYLKDIIQS